MFKKFLRIIDIIKENIFLTKDDRAFINHNLEKWCDYKLDKANGVILTDFYPLKESFIILSYFLNILAKNHESKIVVFGVKNNKWKRVFIKLYKSINASEFVNITLQNNKINKPANNLFVSLRSKDDLINLQYKGISIGIDVYETYLRTLLEPTVNITDIRLLEILVKATNQVDFLLDYFQRNKILACVLSHDCYIPNNIVAKIAYQNNIPVYLPNNRGINTSKKQFDVHNYFINFRNLFSKMTEEKQVKALKFAKERLDKRFSGEVGVDMPYSTKTAFHGKNTEDRVINKSNKPKVLILTHDFFDNPHAYSKFMFPDFYEWLKFLEKMSSEVKYDWYIKTHPDASCETIDIIHKLFGQHTKIKIVPSNISHFQLVEEGVNCAITAHGSIGHEYAMMGVKVINAAFNPHIAYNFNYHAKNIVDYEYAIKNLIKLDIRICKNEIYEFYYMRYFYTFSDSIVFNSYRKISEKLITDNLSVFYLFLNEFNLEKHIETIRHINNFLTSTKAHYFEYLRRLPGK